VEGGRGRGRGLEKNQEVECVGENWA